MARQALIHYVKGIVKTERKRKTKDRGGGGLLIKGRKMCLHFGFSSEGKKHKM